MAKLLENLFISMALVAIGAIGGWTYHRVESADFSIDTCAQHGPADNDNTALGLAVLGPRFTDRYMALHESIANNAIKEAELTRKIERIERETKAFCREANIPASECQL